MGRASRLIILGFNLYNQLSFSDREDPYSKFILCRLFPPFYSNCFKNVLKLMSREKIKELFPKVDSILAL